MTAYVAFIGGAITFGTPLTQTIAIQPVTYNVRLAKIEVAVSGAIASGGAIPALTVFKYIGGTVTGGSALTARALRDGAPATTATVKSGTTPSGTAAQLTNQGMTVAATISYQFVFDCIVNPGVSSLFVSMGPTSLSGGTGSQSLSVQYEELRDNWSV